MGNRAAIVFEGCKGVHVYLHWNGGFESIAAFLKEMERREWYRDDYAPARFCQIVGEFFSGMGEKKYPDDGCSLGVFPGDNPDDINPGDNGVFTVKLEGTHYWFSDGEHVMSTEMMKDVLAEREAKTFKAICDFFKERAAYLKAYKKGE